MPVLFAFSTCIGLTNTFIHYSYSSPFVTSDSKAQEPDVIWLEHDGSISGWVRKVRGDPSEYLTSKQFRTWSVESPAWHWVSIDINFADQEIYLFDRSDRYTTGVLGNG